MVGEPQPHLLKCVESLRPRAQQNRRHFTWGTFCITVDHSLIRKLKIYTEPALLVVDELGYLSLDQQTSNLFYQVISTRHSHKRSSLITTNTAFSDWGNILYNTTIATAIADRLVENSELFLLAGESLRKGNKSQPPTE